MGVIPIEYVVSFSSQDDKHPVENLLSKNQKGPTKCWLSSPSDKSGCLEAELQLSKASYIHFVDIGNRGSSTVEVLVGSSSWPRTKDYVPLLPAVTLMSLVESKINVNATSVKLFTPEHLKEETMKSKWDRVKIVCCQPYRRDSQFGISFVRLSCYESDDSQEEETENSSSKSNDVVKSWLTGIDQTLKSVTNSSPFQNFYSRGHQMLNAVKPKARPVQNNVDCLAAESEEESNVFQLNVLLFLTSKKQEEWSLKDLVEEYKEKNCLQLSSYQNLVFQKVYHSVFEQSSSHTNSVNSHLKATPPKRVVDRTPNGLSSLFCNGKEDQLEFDMDFGSPSSSSSKQTPTRSKSRSECDASSLSRFHSSSKRKRPSGPTHNTIPQLNGAKKPKPVSLLFSRKEDFIQADGSIPSTSKAVTHLDCPICNKPYPISEIELHAATCEDWAPAEAQTLDSSDDEDECRYIPQVLHKKNSCCPEKVVECPVCGHMLEQKELHTHANVCVENGLAY